MFDLFVDSAFQYWNNCKTLPLFSPVVGVDQFSVLSPLGEMGPYILLSLVMLCDAVRILKTTGHFQTYNKLSRAEIRLDLRG